MSTVTPKKAASTTEGCEATPITAEGGVGVGEAGLRDPRPRPVISGIPLPRCQPGGDG